MVIDFTQSQSLFNGDFLITQPSLSGLEEVLSPHSFIDFVKYITAYAVITKLKITNI